MKRLAILIIVIAITCKIFANDFQGKVFEVRKGPGHLWDQEIVFLEDSILLFDMKNGTYVQYPYSVVGGTIVLRELKDGDENCLLGSLTIPYVLKDGTAVLELDLGYDTLVLYDTGRKWYRSNLAFGVIDKATIASGLISGVVNTYNNYHKYEKYYDMERYVRQHKGKAPDGYKGGDVFKNKEHHLPLDANYREYDVDQLVAGAKRNAERLVIDSNWKAYITEDHYTTFTRIF